MRLPAVALTIALLQSGPATLNPEWGAVLPDDQARVFATARLCNRPGAGVADATWTPDAGAIRRLESALAPELQAAVDLQSDPDRRLLAADFYRQYAGLVIGGKRMVYVNGIHRTFVQRNPTSSWKTVAARTCDGGLRAFGAEYDVATGVISKLFFNGGGRGARPWHKGSPRGEALPRELSSLLARSPYEGRIETWCRGNFDGSEAAGFAVALVTARGTVYATVRGEAELVMLASFTGRPDLSCYSRREAEKLNASIRTSGTISGSLTPQWDTTVVCGFIADTEAVCWQYSAEERKFVKVGGWVT